MEPVYSHCHDALRAAIAAEYAGSQTGLARRSGVDRTTINRQVQGHLGISDDCFRRYLLALSPETRALLIRAKLRDLIPEEIQGDVLSYSGFSEIREMCPSDLPDDIAESLQRFGRAMLTDCDLLHWWRSTVRLLSI